jgi:anti-sigma-K factor RskA
MRREFERPIVTCQERQDLLLLYVAGALDANERQEMRAHLASGCQTCAANLLEAHAAWSSIPAALDPHQPASVVKQRLMNRIAEKSDRLPDSLALRIFRILVPAAVAAGIAIIVTHAVLSRRIDELQRETTAEKLLLGFQDQRMRSLEAGLSNQQQITDMLRAPDTRLIKMDATNLQPGATACIIWNPKSMHWELLTCGMALAPNGKTYELWIVTQSGQKIPACTFDVDASGEASKLVAVPHDIGPMAMAAVTDEPAGGMPQPTGHFQFTGKIQ